MALRHTTSRILRLRSEQRKSYRAGKRLVPGVVRMQVVGRGVRWQQASRVAGITQRQVVICHAVEFVARSDPTIEGQSFGFVLRGVGVGKRGAFIRRNSGAVDFQSSLARLADQLTCSCDDLVNADEL